MPKEIIKSADPITEFWTEVSWGRESTIVQIATGDPNTPPTPGDTHARAYYADLDRAAINKLIVILRRARDQAFGRDE